MVRLFTYTPPLTPDTLARAGGWLGAPLLAVKLCHRRLMGLVAERSGLAPMSQREGSSG